MPRAVRPEVFTARKLRSERSFPDIMLWQRLRGKSPRARFRKQYPIGPYVVDFYCTSFRLVEVEGEVHAQPAQIAYGESRNRFLVENGYQTVRINTADIFLKDADGMAASTGSLVARPLHQPPAGPPPRAGED